LWLFTFCHNAFWSFFSLNERFRTLGVTHTPADVPYPKALCQNFLRRNGDPRQGYLVLGPGFEPWAQKHETGATLSLNVYSYRFCIPDELGSYLGSATGLSNIFTVFSASGNYYPRFGKAIIRRRFI
jgi:hypothetical protein